MKYKNILSAIHNLGHSFTSGMNYFDGDHIIYELSKIHGKGYDIEIDWLVPRFSPKIMETARIKKSLSWYHQSLKLQLESQIVELEKLVDLKFHWPKNDRKYMQAKDDRGKKYKIYVNETK